MNALEKGLENIRKLCKRNVSDKHARWAIEQTYIEALQEYSNELIKNADVFEKAVEKFHNQKETHWEHFNIGRHHSYRVISSEIFKAVKD